MFIRDPFCGRKAVGACSFPFTPSSSEVKKKVWSHGLITHTPSCCARGWVVPLLDGHVISITGDLIQVGWNVQRQADMCVS
jgi:hypothetical protein